MSASTKTVMYAKAPYITRESRADAAILVLVRRDLRARMDGSSVMNAVGEATWTTGKGIGMIKIRTQQDWIDQTKLSANKLISDYGYERDDFVVIDDYETMPSMDYGPMYPIEWGETFHYDSDGKRYGGWVIDKYMIGVTLHWPDGTDSSGEGFYASDPIFLLQDAVWWSNMTGNDFGEM